ncbi:hypothetical protein KY358_01405 [Candidatus Woesearchaeota archaeon]|nr:hypothetical protein [Candidatus Woesearchaeota archaeon]
MRKNKKAIEMSLTVVIVAAILLVTATVLLLIFNSLIGKESRQAHSLIGDWDGDNILDMVDKCPCDPGVSEFGGCVSKKDLEDYEKDPTSIDRKCITPQKKEVEKT